MLSWLEQRDMAWDVSLLCHLKRMHLNTFCCGENWRYDDRNWFSHSQLEEGRVKLCFLIETTGSGLDLDWFVIIKSQLWKNVFVSQNSGWMSLHASCCFLLTEDDYQQFSAQVPWDNSGPLPGTQNTEEKQSSNLNLLFWTAAGSGFCQITPQSQTSESRAPRPSRYEPTVPWDREEGPRVSVNDHQSGLFSLLEHNSWSSTCECCCALRKQMELISLSSNSASVLLMLGRLVKLT